MSIDTVKMKRLSDSLAEGEIRGRSLWADARQRFMRNKAAVAGVFMLIFVTLYAFCGEWVAAYTFDFKDFMIMGPRLPTATTSASTMTGATCSPSPPRARGSRSWWGWSAR